MFVRTRLATELLPLAAPASAAVRSHAWPCQADAKPYMRCLQSVLKRSHCVSMSRGDLPGLKEDPFQTRPHRQLAGTTVAL